MIVDAHLDIAYNALHGRDVLRPACEQETDEQGIPTVGLPDLRAGGVGLICGTIFIAPASVEPGGYGTAAEAHAQAIAQLRWYHQQEQAGRLFLVRRNQDLPIDADPGSTLRSIVLLEGADAIEMPEQARWWYEQGVRIVGLAWRGTRYAGGTGDQGPRTSAGRDLVCILDHLQMIHDVSHLAEDSFWQLLERTIGPVIASHSNCRRFIPTDRQLSDEMIRAIVARGGVIGVNFYDKFLITAEARKGRRANLDDVMRHVLHICELAGDCEHVGLGTDLDGGLGREQIPHEITTIADLHLLADAASRAGFTPSDTHRLIGGNWLRFFRERLV